ncbi:ParB/RepB/Spo0J family partition protein [Glutamicibacter nicotianae]|uniref:ParB-like N-terminal domain-containing protein n=1 Tax=Glutamicibacter nicotianae TaxID=37929 RepID=A0ABQ0RLL4_GLUNI|nr:ParB N-terminal domain-containing protein [Glutamicibacter nicotianae]GEC12707.1 hypothetical protein ANI01nite_19100 [Glutamicibacter nicotianae]
MAKFNGRLEVLALSAVHQHPDNIREDLGDLAQLAGEIKSLGLLNPLLVYPHPDREGDFVVQDGNRRRAAAAQAGLTEVPCVVLPEPTEERGARADIETMLTTGRNHRPLTEAEVSKGIQGLLDLGMDITTVGKKFKMSRKEVQARAKVAQKDDGVSKAYSAGRLTLETVQRLQELEEKSDDPQIYERTVARIEDLSNGASLDTVERIIEQTERSVAKDRNREKLQELGAEEAPEHASWSNQYRRIEDELSFEEHQAAGHQWRIDYYESEPTWFSKKETEEYVAPEPTAEEIAEKKYQDRMASKLPIIRASRDKYVISVLQSKDLAESLAKHELVDSIFKANEEDADALARIGQIIDVPTPEQAEDQLDDDFEEEIAKWTLKARRNLEKMTLAQLIFIMKYLEVAGLSNGLGNIRAFERSSNEGLHWFNGWNMYVRYYNYVTESLGYELDPDEVDLMQHFAKKNPNRELAYDLVAVPDEVTATCGGCNQEVVADSEWQGLCIDCNKESE